jgi:hypothetical protein
VPSGAKHSDQSAPGLEGTAAGGADVSGSPRNF